MSREQKARVRQVPRERQDDPLPEGEGDAVSTSGGCCERIKTIKIEFVFAVQVHYAEAVVRFEAVREGGFVPVQKLGAFV